MFENFETPDRVCQQIGFCPKDSSCHLFPKSRFYKIQTKQKRSSDFKYSQLKTSEFELPVANHLPLIDFDGDTFSTIFSLRGYAWRGRDCDDWDFGKRPGRVPVLKNDNPYTDYNCNGIFGFDLNKNQSYESLLCDSTKPMGVAILGDSVAAHFHIPPEWITPSLINGSTYRDVLKILENELDWPSMSSTTGFEVPNWIGTPQLDSISSLYLKNFHRNRCSLRDYQNIAVNGARSGAMTSTIVKTLGRNPQSDNPLLLLLALIGNDLCSSHADFDSMTSPQNMFDNTMKTLQFLDTERLPKGSKVVIIGLADGRLLFDSLFNRIHPIGSVRNDVTYSMLYDYLNCLETSVCFFKF